MQISDTDFRIFSKIVSILILLVLLLGCSPSPIPPTHTSVPPTHTPAPPTATLALPTPTPEPTPSDEVEGIGVDIPLRIMPMGDSITEGVCDTQENCQEPPDIIIPGYGDDVVTCSWSFNAVNPEAVGYRAFLRDMITEQGLEMTYVGSVSVVEGLSHEGHAAWTISDLDYCVLNGNWLENTQPNIILLHIGTNDANYARSPEAMAIALQHLIEHIYTKVPEMTEVIVAQIIPAAKDSTPFFRASNTLMNDIISPYNEKIPEIVQKFQEENKHVSLVDMRGVIHSDNELDNMLGLHPNAKAAERMAQIWLTKILEVIEKNP